MNAKNRSIHLSGFDKSALLVIFLVTAVLYLPAMDRWVIGDDFRNVEWAVFDGFNVLADKGRYFRPIENFVNALNTQVLGVDHNFINYSINFLGLFCATVLVMVIARCIHPCQRFLPAIISSSFAFSSMGVSSVIQIDTVSQQYATVFSLAALAWFLVSKSDHLSVYRFVGALFCFLALISKESAFGFVFLLPFALVLLRGASNSAREQTPQEVFFLIAPAIAACVAVYLLVRMLTDSYWGGGSSPQGISLNPVTAIRNAVFTLAPTFYSGSTLDLFPTLQIHRIIFSIGLSLILAVCALTGLSTAYTNVRKSDLLTNTGEFMQVSGLALLMFGSLFPVALLDDYLTELWIYGPLPFSMLLIWLLAARGWEVLSPKIGEVAQPAAGVFLATLLAWLSFGVSEKVSHSLETSRESRLIYDTIIERLPTLPPGEIELCFGPDPFGKKQTVVAPNDSAALSGLHTRIENRVEGHYHIYFEAPRGYVNWWVRAYFLKLFPDRPIVLSNSQDCYFLIDAL